MAADDRSLHGYIAKAQRQGISQNRTMQELRQAGFRFSDATFRSTWGEIQNARATRGAIADANIGRRPLGHEISQISGGKSGQFLYRFDLLLRRAGEREVLRTHVGVKTDRLITYNNAATRVLENFLANEEQYESYVVDWIPAAVNEFTG